MRGWLSVAALCTILLAVPAWGQRGGGGRGGGGHGGGGGFHGGGFSGRSRGGYGGNGYGYRGYGYPGYGYGYRGYGYPGYGYGGYRGYGYGYGGYGYGYGRGWRGWGWGYPWWGGSWYPWWGWDSWDNSDSSYPSDSYAGSNYQAQPYPSTVYVNPAPPPGYSNSQANQTQDEIDSLKDQVAQLRSQQEGKSAPAEPRARTVLVYRDGHTEQVDDYAIVGKTLWVFNETRARRVALSELDLPATKRDNEDRGIDFTIPRTSQPAHHAE
jgi:hypothetical protein